MQTLMRDYKDQLHETFLQLTASQDGEGGTLECPTALAWLEQCGLACGLSADGCIDAPPKMMVLSSMIPASQSYLNRGSRLGIQLCATWLHQTSWLQSPLP